MRVGVIGRTGMLLETARQILARGHEIAFVMTCRAEAYYEVDESHFRDLAAELGCPFYEGVNPNEHVDDIKRLGAQVCVSINWLTLLKERFLTAFPFGVLNAHAGDLPRYKGNACANWAILNFEPSIGLTVHRMTEALDSGPYILKRLQKGKWVVEVAVKVIGFDDNSNLQAQVLGVKARSISRGENIVLTMRLSGTTLVSTN